MPDIKLTGKSRRWEKRAGALETKVQSMGKSLDIFSDISDNLSEPLKKQIGTLQETQEHQKGRLKLMENAVRIEKMIHRDVGELNTVTDVFRQGIKDSARAMKTLTFGILETFDDLLDTFLGPLWRFTKQLVGGLGIFGGRLFKVTIGKWFFGMGKKEADAGKEQLQVMTDVRDELYKQLKTNPNLGEHIMSMDESMKGIVGFQPEMMRFMELMAQGNKHVQYFWKENRELEEEAENTRHKTLIETLKGLGDDIGEKTGGFLDKILTALGIKKLLGLGRGVRGRGRVLLGGAATMGKIAAGVGLVAVFTALFGHEFEKGYRKGGIKGGLASWLTSWFSPIGLPTKIFLTEEQQEKFRGGLIRMFTNIQNMLPWLGVVGTYAEGIWEDLKAQDWESMKRRTIDALKKSIPFVRSQIQAATDTMDEWAKQLRDILTKDLWKVGETKYVGPGEGFWDDIKIDFTAAINQWKNFFKGIIKWIEDAPYNMYRALRDEISELEGSKGTLLRGVVGTLAPVWEKRYLKDIKKEGEGVARIKKLIDEGVLTAEELKTKTSIDPNLAESLGFRGVEDLTIAINKLIASTEKLHKTNEELRKKKPEEGRSNFIGLGGTEGDGLNIFRAMGAMQ